MATMKLQPTLMNQIIRYFILTYGKRSTFSVFLVIILLSACSAGQSTPTAVLSPAVVELPVETPVPPSPEPTSVPIRDKLVLWIPTGLEGEETSQLQQLLAEWAGRDGLEMLSLNSVDQQSLGPDIRLVIAWSASAEVQNLAAAHPEIQFVAISAESLQPAQNLSIIHVPENRPDMEGFAAGYLAAVLTPHWRVGVIGTPDDPNDKSWRNGFTNGMIFFCGLCRPSVPPFVQYPIMINAPMGADAGTIQAALDPFKVNEVKTVFVAAHSLDPMVLEELAAAGVKMISLNASADSIRDQTIASLGRDYEKALEIIWPKAIAGEGGQQLNSDLMFRDVNPDLLTVGRLQFVEQMLTDLSSGYIDTGVVPETGEMK